MIPATLGNKHTCRSCDARFYDLNKEPAACPKCSHVVVAVIKAATRPVRRHRMMKLH